MSNENLAKATKDILVQAPLAVATTGGASAAVDCANFLGVKFTHILGTLGSTDIVAAKIQGSETTTAWADCYDSVAASKVTQSSTAGNDDKLLVLDVFLPQTRFLRSFLTNSTDSEYGGTVATLYGPRTMPVSFASSTYGTTGGPMLSVSPGTT